MVFLFENGADINAKGKGGKTSLRYAAHEGHDEVVEKLLRWGADPDLVDVSGKSSPPSCLHTWAHDSNLARKYGA